MPKERIKKEKGRWNGKDRKETASLLCIIIGLLGYKFPTDTTKVISTYSGTQPYRLFKYTSLLQKTILIKPNRNREETTSLRFELQLRIELNKANND